MTYEEIDNLKIGDIFLYGKNKTPRTVRGITKGSFKSPKPYETRMVRVSIRKCSWTVRCDTYVDRCFLKHYCEATNLKNPLNTPDDKLWFKAIKAIDWLKATALMNCCMVKSRLDT